jgi:hypothetical protein
MRNKYLHKSFVIGLITWVYCLNGWSQSRFEVAALKMIDCYAVEEWVNDSLGSLYWDQFIDTESVKIKWKKKCGKTEPQFRYSILTDLYNNIPIKLSPNDFYQFERFSYRMNGPGVPAEYPAGNYKYQLAGIPIGGKFDKFTQYFANFMHDSTKQNSLEKSILDLYSGNINAVDDFYKKNKKAPFSNKYRISKYPVWKKHSRIILRSGIWIPTADLSEKIPPRTAIEVGAFTRITSDMRLGINFGLQFGNSKRIEVEGMTNIQETNNTVGFNIDAEINKTLFVLRQNAISIIGKLGYTALPTDVEIISFDSDGNESTSNVQLGSYLFAAGLQVERPFFKRNGIQLNVLYNITDYEINRRLVTPLQGNSFSVLLGFLF